MSTHILCKTYFFYRKVKCSECKTIIIVTFGVSLYFEYHMYTLNNANFFQFVIKLNLILNYITYYYKRCI